MSNHQGRALVILTVSSRSEYRSWDVRETAVECWPLKFGILVRDHDSIVEDMATFMLPTVLSLITRNRTLKRELNISPTEAVVFPPAHAGCTVGDAGRRPRSGDHSSSLMMRLAHLKR